LWPPEFWHNYLNATPLNLPGTSLMRLDPTVVTTLQEITQFLTQRCDTFYSTPPSDSLYIYSKIPPPTGLVIDWYGVLNTAEQREIAASLNSAIQRGERVCIVREASGYPNWAASSTGQGPLGIEVSTFNQQIGDVNNYSVWTRSP
jgi:hypothetical protein